MRLLNTLTGELKSFEHRIPRYAILSHVWGKDEQSFQDVTELTSRPDDGYADDRATPETARVAQNRLPLTLSAKLRACCAYAASLGYSWIWVDTCCIDKTNGTELSEAINSMYTWYSNADVCLAYLHDVPDGDDPNGALSVLPRSRWFDRGWTLQELIAPRSMLFMSRGWKPIGDKKSLAPVLANITGIDCAVLTFERQLSDVCVAERMRWAAYRETTRAEDRAYSLQGLFDVHMPTLYGEGGNAFRRLQEAILRRSPDHSLFAWDEHSLRSDGPTGGLLADDVSQFRSLRRLNIVPVEDLYIAAQRFRAAIAQARQDGVLGGAAGKRSFIGTQPSTRGGDGIREDVPSFSITAYGIQARVLLIRAQGQTTAIAILAMQRESCYTGLILEKLPVASTPPSYSTLKAREGRLVYVGANDRLHLLAWPSLTHDDLTISWEDAVIRSEPSAESTTPNGDVLLGFPYRFIPSHVFAKLARHGFFAQYTSPQVVQPRSISRDSPTAVEAEPTHKPGKGALTFAYHDSSARKLAETSETFCVFSEVLAKPGGNYTILHLSATINGRVDLRRTDTPSLWTEGSKAFGDEERRIWLTNTHRAVQPLLGRQDTVDIDLLGSVYADLAHRYNPGTDEPLHPQGSVESSERGRLDELASSSGASVALETQPTPMAVWIASARNGFSRLIELMKVYPFTSDVVMTFAAAEQLSGVWGVSDEAIGAAMYAMRGTMSVLPRLLPTEGRDPMDVQSVPPSLRDFIAALAGDIKTCAHACDALSQQSCSLRMLPNQNLERRKVAEYATLFYRRTRELESMLAPPSYTEDGSTNILDVAHGVRHESGLHLATCALPDRDSAGGVIQPTSRGTAALWAGGESLDLAWNRLRALSATGDHHDGWGDREGTYVDLRRRTSVPSGMAVNRHVTWIGGRRSVADPESIYGSAYNVDRKNLDVYARQGREWPASRSTSSERELRDALAVRVAQASDRLLRMERLVRLITVLFLGLVVIVIVFVCLG